MIAQSIEESMVFAHLIVILTSVLRTWDNNGSMSVRRVKLTTNHNVRTSVSTHRSSPSAKLNPN